MAFFVNGVSMAGHRVEESVPFGAICDCVRNELARDAMNFFGRMCDEHNESRAVHYARRHIQQMATFSSRSAEVYRETYSFEQFSDIHDTVEETRLLLAWAGQDAPTLFRAKARKISR